MNKNANAKKYLRLKLISFWSLIGLFTTAFLVVMIVMFVELRSIESYQDIEKAKLTLIGHELFNQPEDSYYVYIYTSNEDNTKIDTLKAQELKPAIFNYFNFARQYSRREETRKIYGFDVYNNRSCVGTVNTFYGVSNYNNFKVNEANLPMLLYVEGGQGYTMKITANDIRIELQNAMERVRNVGFEALLPKKESYF